MGALLDRGLLGQFYEYFYHTQGRVRGYGECTKGSEKAYAREVDSLCFGGISAARSVKVY